MASKQGPLFKTRATLVSPLTGETFYSIDGVICPKQVPYVTITCGVSVDGVYLDKNLWPFQSSRLCWALDARLRWYRRWRLPARMKATVLTRFIPNTDPDWPGVVMPEVVLLRVHGLKAVFENERSEVAENLALV